MKISLATDNLKMSLKQIYDHNNRIGKNTNQDIDHQKSDQNIYGWNRNARSNFYDWHEMLKNSAKKQNEKYKSKGQYDRMKTFSEKYKDKSFVSEIVFALPVEPEKFKQVSKHVLQLIQEEWPASMSRLLGKVIHLDEKTPHLHLTFHNFKLKENGEMTLDSAWYSKDFTKESRCNTRNIHELEKKLEKYLMFKFPELHLEANAEMGKGETKHVSSKFFKSAVNQHDFEFTPEASPKFKKQVLEAKEAKRAKEAQKQRTLDLQWAREKIREERAKEAQIGTRKPQPYNPYTDPNQMDVYEAIQNTQETPITPKKKEKGFSR